MFNSYGKRTENSCTILPKSRRQSRRRFGIIYPEQKEPSRTAKTQQGERKRIMAIKIGINGFGRIGRVVLRILAEDPEQYEICGINLRKADVDYMVYLLKYDSVFRNFNGTVEHEGGDLVVNGHKIKVFSQSDAAMIPWHECGAEYIIESTGAYCTTEKAPATSRAAPRRCC